MDRDQTHQKEKLICIQRQSVVFFWGSILIFLVQGQISFFFSLLIVLEPKKIKMKPFSKENEYKEPERLGYYCSSL